jgi:hypothetical protein
MARSDAMTRTNTASQRTKGDEVKKFLVVLALLIGFTAISTGAWAADTLSQSLWCEPKNADVCVFTFNWLDETADGVSYAMTTSNFNKIKGYYAYAIITNPGATAPTDNYDITLPDADGIDLAGGLLANRSSTVSQRIVPKVDETNSIYGGAPLLSPITLTIADAGQNQAGATGTVIIVLWRK